MSAIDVSAPIKRPETPVVPMRIKRKRAPSLTPSLYEEQVHRTPSPPPPVPALPYTGPPTPPGERDYDSLFLDAEPPVWCACCKAVVELIGLGLHYAKAFMCGLFCH